jgi:hypothetical protein
MKKRFVTLEMVVVAVIALTVASVLTVSGTTLVGGSQSASDVQDQVASTQDVVSTTTIPSTPAESAEGLTTDPTAPQAAKAPGNFSPTIIIVPAPAPIETTTTTLNMADYCRMPDFVSLGLLKAPFLGFDLWLNSGMREACDSGGFGAGLGSRVVTGCVDESMASLVQTDNANNQAFMRFVDQSPQAGTLIRRFNASSAFHVTVHLWQSDWTNYPELISVPRC